MKCDLSGKVFGWLTVVGSDASRGFRKKWECRCRCGVIKFCEAGQLNAGRVLSCGCRPNKRSFKHGLTNSSLYTTWWSMKSRCYNPNAEYYHCYGGRGIKICERWMTFSNFAADMGPKPPGRSIGRIDNDGDYSPENCRWETAKQQARNTKLNRFITINGKTLTLGAWAEQIGLTSNSLKYRIKQGWTDSELLLPKLPK